jgi:hypothetical protein
MKKVTAFFTGIILTSQSYCQTDSPTFAYEVGASVNYTTISDANKEGKPGFGVGGYFVLRPEQSVSFLFGLEYNHTRHYSERIDYVFPTWWDTDYYETEVDYFVNAFSFPVAARLSYGNRTKVFIELGGFLDINFSTGKNATLHHSDTLYLNGVATQKYYYESQGDFSDIDFGPAGGVGVLIPIRNKEFIVKTEYKHALSTLYEEISIIRNAYVRLMLGIRI